MLERRRPPWGRALVAVLGLVGVVAAVTRANSGQLAVAPSLVAIVVAVLVLGWLTRRLSAVTASEYDAGRRRFLIAAGVTAGIGVLAVLGGRMLTAGQQATQAVRTAFKLPAAATPASAVPAGASFDVAGLSPLVTPNKDFYRIDTALQVPVVDPKTWTLKISGWSRRR